MKLSDIYSINENSYPVEREYLMTKFLDEFFWKCFFMLKMNHIKGDYLEFGCGSNIRSFRLAYKYMKLENDNLKLFAFDSFEGLPEPVGIDKHHQWKKGSMKVSQDEFNRTLKLMGASEKEYHIVPGFYEDTLDNILPSRYGIKNAAMIFIDCDLYASTSSVLRFVKDIFVDGTIIAFDDWFCFNGNPGRGEQRAFYEFRELNPELKISEYLNFGWHGKSFIIHR